MGSSWQPPDPPTTRVWLRPNRLAYAETLRGLGGIVAPLLAGFSLAAIAALLTGESTPPLGEEALAAFSCAVALLLVAMQVAFLALSHTDHPEQHLLWYPEATVDDEALDYARRRQAEDYALIGRYWTIAGRAYNLGLAAFLSGVLLLLWPEFWSLARGLAFGVAAAALALEVWWFLTPIGPIPHPVARQSIQHDPPEPLDEVSRRAVRAMAPPAAPGENGGARREPAADGRDRPAARSRSERT